ncbi:MAG: NADPH:quinone oxidoreductase family protein [Pseudomonadota bacterium]
MKAALVKAYGPPDSIVVEEVPSPEPGAGEVRIRIRACGVNFPDVLMVAGKYQFKPEMPFSPGAEMSGDIDAVGDGVEHLKIGQRVFCMVGHGGMAEQIVVPAAAVVPIPDALDYRIAAAIMMTYGTSYHALKQRAQIQPGETLLVLGAAGGVGLAAVELGVKMGARVIAAASNEEKLDLARQYGASECINYTEVSLKDTVKAMTGGQGVDVIYDPVGGGLFDDCLRALAWRGRLLVIGFASGEIPSAPANLPLLKGASVVGVFWGAFTQREREANDENTRELMQWLMAGELKPHVGSVLPLDRAGEAMNILARREALGKVVIEMP